MLIRVVNPNLGSESLDIGGLLAAGVPSPCLRASRGLFVRLDGVLVGHARVRPVLVRLRNIINYFILVAACFGNRITRTKIKETTACFSESPSQYRNGKEGKMWRCQP